MKLNKVNTIALSLVILSTLVAPVYANSTTESSISPFNNTIYEEMENMDIGDIVCVGDLAIERVSDDDEGPQKIDPRLRQTTEGFDISNFGGNRNYPKTLGLNSTFKYWYIYIKNTGSNMTVTIGNDEKTQTDNFHKIPNGTYYIWSTNAWPTNSQLVDFTCGSGLYGNASARLCSTLKEAENHNE